MKTYLQMDGDKLVEYVEKREYDSLRFSFNAVSAERDTFEAQRNVARNQLDRICEEGLNSDDTIGLEPADDYILRKLAELKQALNQRLQDAVKRMEKVTDADLVLAYWAGSHSTLVHEGANRVRNRLIQAAKGEP